MTNDLRNRLAAAIGGALAALAFAGAAAGAPVTVEEVTVTGKEPPKGRPESMSYRVTYHDLDLKKQQDYDEFLSRIKVTAGFVCSRLAEDDRSLSRPDCESRAVTDAGPAVAKARHDQRAHGAKSSPGSAWVAPTIRR